MGDHFEAVVNRNVGLAVHKALGDGVEPVAQVARVNVAHAALGGNFELKAVCTGLLGILASGIAEPGFGFVAVVVNHDFFSSRVFTLSDLFSSVGGSASRSARPPDA